MLSAPGIPIGLSNLFEDADFIASAPEGTKPCFNSQSHVNDKTLLGWAFRRAAREKRTGTMQHIRRICDAMAEALNRYQRTMYHDVIVIKMIELRMGILRIHRAYADDCVVQGHLKTSIIVLDLHIPKSAKEQYGITPLFSSSIEPPQPHQAEE